MISTNEFSGRSHSRAHCIAHAFWVTIGECRLFDEVSSAMVGAFSIITRSHAARANPTGAFVGRVGF